MATSNNTRDVKLVIKTEVDGTEDIDKLRDSIDGVGKAGAGAAPGAAQLAAQLEAAAAATKKYREAERAAVAEETAAKVAVQAKKDALKLLNITTDAATQKTDEFKAKVIAEKVAIHEGEIATRALTAARKAATAEAIKAAAAQEALNKKAQAAAAAVAKSTGSASADIDRVAASGTSATEILQRMGPLIATAFSARQFVETITAQESLNRGFEQIFGSAGKAASEMGFVRTTADKLGIEVQTLARSYQSLSASTKGTVLEGQATREVFEAVSRAMTTLGKSSAETDRALTAVSQIASKGTASMEELRGQLGEALPGAMKAAADGAGITVEQLVAMVSNGTVLASDILPALTKGLNDLYAKGTPPQTITTEFARLKNTITDTMVALGDGGVSKAIAKSLSAATLGVRGVSNAADVAGTAVGEFVAKLVTGNYELGTAAELNAKFDAEMRNAAVGAGLVSKAQAGATEATQAQVRAVDNATAAHEKSVESMLAVKVRYNELATQADKYTDAVKAQGIARQAESAVVTQLVNVYGTEVERRQAAAAAAAVQATSSRDLARAKDAEAIIAQSLALKLQEEALKRNDTTEATRKEILNATQSATTKRAEADQSIALAKSKGIEVEAAKASAAAYADNSARVYELRGAVGSARAEVERLTAAQKLGKATDEDVSAARAKLSAATLLYRDALNDASEAAERQVRASQRSANLVQGSIAVDRARAEAAIEVAEATGDATVAAQAHEQATRVQINAANAQAEAASREAAAIRNAADTRETELRATGQLTSAKADEIQATRDAAAAKDQEAQQATILADKLIRLADADKKRAAQVNESLTADGFKKNKDGSAAGQFNNLTPLDQAFAVKQSGGKGMTVDQLQAAKKQADDAKTWLDNMVKSGGGGSISREAFTSVAALQTATSTALAAAMSREKLDARQKSEQDAPRDNKTLTINIAGRSTPIGLTGPEDRNLLMGILRQLETASGRS